MTDGFESDSTPVRSAPLTESDIVGLKYVDWQSFEAFTRRELFSEKLDAKSLFESLEVWEGRNHWPRWRVPLWSMTIPLILLSPYLILWKPRTRGDPTSRR